MANVLEIDRKKMHSIKLAAAESGYSRDHITKLAREQKIVAVQVGRSWYVDLDSLLQYAHVTQLEQQVKQKHLSESRRIERDVADSLAKRHTTRARAHAKQVRRVKVTSATAAVLFAFMVSALGYFGSDLTSLAKQQIASAPSGITDPVISSTTNTFQSDQAFIDGSVEVSYFASDREAIILLPEMEDASTTTMFSDPVEVVVDETGVSEVRLIGDATGIPSVVVPISERKIP